MEKREQKNTRKRTGKKKRRISYRQKIVYMQIAVITFAVFLGLMVGAAALTKVSREREAAKIEQEQKKEQDGIENENTDVPSEESGADTKEEEEDIPNVAAETPTPTPEPVSITVSLVGDCTLGTDVNFNPESSFDAFYIVKRDPGYFFKNVKDIFAEDDLTIVNMEGTLTTSQDRQDKTYAFKGDPSYTEILVQGGVEAANLANNHSRDYGEQSFTDTKQYLQDAGITTFGYDETAIMDVKGVKVGLIGIYVLRDGLERSQQVIDTIQAVKDQGAQVVIVSFHWGIEKETVPEATQKTLAHLAVDQGADLVVGHHPHVLQGIEKYQGKNIVYSLGNFCFGGNRNPADKDTMIFQQTFTIENNTLVQDDVTNIIPCSLSSVAEYNDYQPKVLEGSEKDRVLQKIETLSQQITP